RKVGADFGQPDAPDHLAFGCMNRSEEHTSELQSLAYLVCRLLLEKKKRPIEAGGPNRRSARSCRQAPGRRARHDYACRAVDGCRHSLCCPRALSCAFFFFNDRAPTEIYALSLHDALPI